MSLVVAILGQDPVLDRALGQLLRGIGYHTRLIAELPEDGADDPLGGVHLLLFTPGSKGKLRETMLANIQATPDGKNVPVLELVTNLEEIQAAHAVPWPCRAEELKRRIEAVL